MEGHVGQSNCLTFTDLILSREGILIWSPMTYHKYTYLIYIYIACKYIYISSMCKAITPDDHGPQPNMIRPEPVGLITHIKIYVCNGASPCPVIVHLVLVGSVDILMHLHASRSSVSWVPLWLPRSRCASSCDYNLIIGTQARQ